MECSLLEAMVCSLWRDCSKDVKIWFLTLERLSGSNRGVLNIVFKMWKASAIFFRVVLRLTWKMSFEVEIDNSIFFFKSWLCELRVTAKRKRVVLVGLRVTQSSLVWNFFCPTQATMFVTFILFAFLAAVAVAIFMKLRPSDTSVLKTLASNRLRIEFTEPPAPKNVGEEHYRKLTVRG